MKKTLALALFLTVSFVVTGEDSKVKQEAFHRFLVGYNALQYGMVFHGEIRRVIPEGYRKSGRVLDVLQINVINPVRPAKKKGIRHILYSRRNFDFKKGESYLFFVRRNGRLSFIDPPLPVEGTEVRIDDRTYPLTTVLGWAAPGVTLRSLVTRHREFFMKKRIRDRQAGFVLKMRRKEIFLLYKINNKSTLKEKVLWFIELGHTRINLKKYDKAENAFLYVKKKYSVDPIISLMADRGLALLLFYRGNTVRAITRFEALMKTPAAADGYRATLRIDLARLYELGKNMKEAEKQYRLAATEFPARYHDRSFALFNLGELQRRQHKYRDALVSYRKSYSLFNTHLAAEFRKGNTRFPAWYFALKQRIRRKGR